MPSSLLSNLAAAWPLNERGGENRYDWVGGNTLAAVNAPGRTTGKVTWGTAFVAASSQYLTRASNAALSMDAGTGWWIWTWVRLSTLPASNASFGLVSKQDSTVGREYSLYLFNNGGVRYDLTAAVHAPDNSAVTPAKTVTPDTTTWHLAEAWYDPVAQTVSVAWDGGTPATAAKTTATRSAGATLHIGSLYNVLGFLNGSLSSPNIRKQAPTSPERAAVWNAGAGAEYPFAARPTPVVTLATLDNSGGATTVAAGTPLPLWLPASFDWSDVVWPNGDDLAATDNYGNALKLWPEVVDASNRYGRVWVETPAGGVAAGGAVGIQLHPGDASHQATDDYDALFAKRSPDAHTVALYHLDTFASTTSPEASGGTVLTLVGAPTKQTSDGGNFRVRTPAQSFVSGGHLSFDGTTQYATVAGLLASPPAAGSVGVWLKQNSTPTADNRVWSVINVRSGSTITEGLELILGAGKLRARMTKAGSAYDADFVTFALPSNQWWHVVVEWGSVLRLTVNGCVFGQNAVTGAWGNANGTATPFSLGAQVLSSPGALAAVSVDELEVRNVQPTSAEIRGWFNRGGFASTYEQARWTVNPVPLLAATLPAEQSVVFEPRLVRLGAGNWVGEYTGGNANASLFGMTSTDGKVLVKTNTKIMGNGAGGWSGDACRGRIFRDDDGILYLYFTDAIATTGGSIHWATTTDSGATWTHQGVVLAPDAVHTGWANTALFRSGSTYHWAIEYTKAGAGQQYFTATFTSTSPTGPLTLVDDRLLDLTLKMGNGSISTGGFGQDAGRSRLFPHCTKLANAVLPTSIHFSDSDDGLRWRPRGGGDPVIDLRSFDVFPHQDQAADAHVYAMPDTGEVGLLYDIDDNHGGGLQTRIMGATFSGSLADLDDEYPQLVIGSAVGPPSTPTPAAALLCA